MRIRRRYQEPSVCTVPTPKTAVVAFRAVHKEKCVGIVVDVVERVACAGIPAVIHDKEACFLVIVLCIKHTVAVCNAEIAVIVLILRKLRCDRNRLETVSVRLPVIDISIFLSTVICSR